jgi:Ca2+:H+ antiporter
VLGLTGRQLGVVGVSVMLVVGSGVSVLSSASPVVRFVLAGLALAAVAALVGVATDELGCHVGVGRAGVVQSALGNLPELLVALFALHQGLPEVVQAALIGSILSNSLLVLGLAMVVGGWRHGVQSFHSPRARLTATLTMLAAATLAIPTFTSALHTHAARHERTLSLIGAGVLLVIFAATLPGFLSGVAERSSARSASWPLRTTVGILFVAAAGATLTSDWFVGALRPAIATLHVSQGFVGLVVVAIVGNAVENVVGVRLFRDNRPDFAVSVILNSSLQVALALTPILVFASLFFATSLTLVFPPLLIVALLLAAVVGALVINDGESTWGEGFVLNGLYTVIAASFWWGA